MLPAKQPIWRPEQFLCIIVIIISGFRQWHIIICKTNNRTNIWDSITEQSKKHMNYETRKRYASRWNINWKNSNKKLSG